MGARSPKYDRADIYASQRCGKSQNLAIMRIISGRLVSKISKIDPQAEHTPSIPRTPKFGLEKAIRRHLWASPIGFLHSRSPTAEIPGAVNLGGFGIKIPIRIALWPGIGGKSRNLTNSAKIIAPCFLGFCKMGHGIPYFQSWALAEYLASR